jgi:hypothetical protein
MADAIDGRMHDAREDFEDVATAPVVRNESAYQAAIARNIRANAQRGYLSRYGDEATIVLDAIDNNAHKQGFWASLAQAVEQYGRPTDKQHAAVLRIIAEMQAKREEYRRRDAETSQHVGVVGQRLQTTVTVAFLTQYQTEYGTQYITGLRDASGNVLIAETTRPFGDGINRGAVLTVTAYVKAHSERDGVKQTLVNRIKVVDTQPAG